MIKNLLLPLTPSRSYYIFIFFFSTGTLLTVFDYYTPWSPALVVMFYGGILWYVQDKLFQVLNDPIRNSPYFLGFLFTLVSLFTIFLKTSESETFFNISFLSRQIGSALTTTIVGLLFRQALITFDPGEDQRVAIFQSLMEELRENASAYKQTQRELIKVLKDFVNTREELYQKEEQMSSKYLSLMSRNYEGISQLLQKYPPQLNSLFKNIDDTLNEFREKIINNITKTHNEGINESLNKITQFNTHYINEVKSGFDNLLNSLEIINDPNIHKYTENYINGLNITSKKYSDALKNACETMTDKIPAQIDSLNNVFKSSIDSLNLFNDSLKGFRENTQVLPLEITNVCNSLKKSMEEYEITLKSRLNMLEKEIKSINMIMDEFINVTTEKIQRLK